MQHLLEEMAFKQLGLEPQDFDDATDRLKLEEDPQYQILEAEQIEKI